MITRQIHNVGQPFLSPQGRPLAGIELKFTLVDPFYHSISVFDKDTKEKVVGETRVRTNAKGEFKVNLWPNTRGDVKSLYLVHSDTPGIERFASVLVDEPNPIALFDFKYLYRDVPFTEYNVLVKQFEAMLATSYREKVFEVEVEDHDGIFDIGTGIVPGSEWVFLNGDYLTNGEDSDYTVDGSRVIFNPEQKIYLYDKVAIRYNISVG